MEKISALLALCAGNSPVTGEFPSQRPVMQSFDGFFDLRLNNPLSKQPRCQWFEMPSGPLWHHCNEVAQIQTKMVPINLIWSESAWVIAESWCPQYSRGPYHAHGYAHYALMGKWPWGCMSRGQDSSSELNLEGINPLVVDFRHSQDSKNPYHTHDDAHYALMAK